MKMLVVATHILVPGSHGGSTHVSELVNALRRHGRVLLLARQGSSGRDTLGVAWWKKLPPRGLGHALSAAYLTRCLGAVREFAPDVIYERGSSMGLGWMLSRLLKLPLLVMVLDEHVSPLSLAAADRIIATRMDVVPARYHGKTHIVSWGANADRFRPDIDGQGVRQRLGWSAEQVVVAYTGSFQPWHGLTVLVRAAARLREFDSFRFLLIGGGHEEAAIRALINELGLQDRIVITGKVPYDEVPEYLAAADVAVAPFEPSRHAPSSGKTFTLDPLKIFEYLAMGLPTVTVGADNIMALFSAPDEIRTFAESDDADLATVLADVAQNLDVARAQAAAGRQKVLARHTWQGLGDHLAQLFGDMLAERRR